MMRPAPWVVLVAAPGERLQELIMAWPPARADAELVEIVPAGGGYAAVGPREGAEGSGEEVARTLSMGVDDPVYLLDLIEDAVLVYERGRLLEVASEPPRALGGRLGIVVRGIPERPRRPPVRTVALVRDRKPPEVAGALGIEPHSGSIRIAQRGTGTILSSDEGDVAVFVHELSEALNTRVYLLATDSAGPRLACHVVDRGRDVGVYEYPERTLLEYPPLAEIEGAQLPDQILSRLDVPRELLGLGDQPPAMPNA